MGKVEGHCLQKQMNRLFAFGALLLESQSLFGMVENEFPIYLDNFAGKIARKRPKMTGKSQNAFYFSCLEDDEFGSFVEKSRFSKSKINSRVHHISIYLDINHSDFPRFHHKFSQKKNTQRRK